jgi:hypothetical protein
VVKGQLEAGCKRADKRKVDSGLATPQSMVEMGYVQDESA